MKRTRCGRSPLWLLAWACLPAAALAQEAPANDLFANAQGISGVAGNVPGSNVNATAEDGEPPTTAGWPSGSSVWFSWTAPVAAPFAFRLTADFDSQLAVYTGDTVSTLTSIDESDSRSLGGDSVTFAAAGGTTYLIRVTGCFAVTGSFTLRWSWSGLPVYERVFSFTEARVAPTGYPSSGALLQAVDGYFYGTTATGGASACGAVLKMTREGVLTTLVEFTGTTGANKGSEPAAPLVQGSDGCFYGTTKYGGADDCGTVFRMTSAGELTTLVEFTSTGVANRGASPSAALLQASDGNFYGTTSEGGADGAGTVFMMTPSGVLTTLVEFTGNGSMNRGRYPQGALVSGNEGYLYGTTAYGGADGYGTVFKMTPGGELTTLVDFTNTGVTNRGSYPGAGVVPGSDGDLYGTTYGGGADYHGTIFRVTPAGVLTTLVEFTGNGTANRGVGPTAALVLGGDGDFYGTTWETGYGSTANWGTVFKMTPAGELTTLVEFTWNGASNRGAKPRAGLVQGSDGDFYGTTAVGGTIGSGTAFRMTPAGDLTTLVDFTGGGEPTAGSEPNKLVQSRNGSLYGTTRWGGLAASGSAFKITPAGALTSLVHFTASNGARPSSALVESTDGDLYGTTEYGGASNLGTVFRMTPGGVLTTLVEFTGNGASNQGSHPSASLVQADSGDFYGVTPIGGANDQGTVFRMTPAGILTTLVEFNANDPVNKGYSPSGLMQASDGNFYGTTETDGAAGWGTIFRMTPAGEITTLAEFTGYSGPNQGVYPSTGLVQGSDGDLYGTTTSGGPVGGGTIFKITPAGELTTLAEFTGTSPPVMGYRPNGLLVGHDGDFYGTTHGGGASSYGTVFKISPDGVLTTLHEFATEGNPASELVAGLDGNLYGTTGAGDGTIYRMVFLGPPNVFPLEPASLTRTSAVVQCKLNPRGAPTRGSLEYGNDGVAFPNVILVPQSLTGYQSILVGRTLGDLAEGTTYYYRFRATNAVGETVGPVQSVSTLAEPVVSAAPPSEVAPTTARFGGTVNARNYEATVVFEWGTDGNSFPNSVGAVPPTVTGNTDLAVSAAVAGLIPGETYYYRLVASNLGGTAVSGQESFRTLTEPVALLTGASPVSTTRAQVQGTVDAQGSTATVSFEYGTDGVTFDKSAAAVPGVVSGEGAVAVSATLSSLLQGTTYHYRLRATGPGGTGLSATGTFTLNILSGLVQVFPDAPPLSTGTLTVLLAPVGVGAWRMAGEQQWRGSGAAATNLASGVRWVEYLPVPGHIRPLAEVVDVVSGEDQVLARSYFQTPVGGSGSLTVYLKPEGLAGPEVPEGTRAQWRLPGEAWADSGTVRSNLVAGTYLVECKAVAGRVTPAVAAVTIGEGDQRELTLTYFRANDPVGAGPEPLSFEEVSADEDLPFAYLGQIRSEVGLSTGFVVKRRVVATAGHVVFDDGTLSYLTKLQWLFQRQATEYEPKPQEPRGYYLAAGYAAQREAEASPGESSPQSQALDYAALYFLEEAGRGGYGGFLASESVDENEFLDSSAEKMLAGYAVDGIGEEDRGKLHATAIFTLALSPAYGATWTTAEVYGVGGCSGGPLLVKHSNGRFYPAAIYLGGSGQTVVRAIDRDMIELFDRAETSANGGGNNTSGGITHTEVTAFGSATEPGSVKVIIEPAGAREAGARWRLLPDPVTSQSGWQVGGLAAGTYTLELTTVSGYQVPSSTNVVVQGGSLNTFTYTYEPLVPPNTAPVLAAVSSQAVDELTMLVVTNVATDADMPANTLLFALVSGPPGVSLDSATGVLTWTPTEAQGPSTNTVTVRVSDNGQPSLSATNSFTVVVREANTAPVLVVPGSQTVDELTMLVVTNVATDADLPATTLVFALVSGPTGVSLDPATGVLTWMPTEAQGPSTNTVTVRVSDNGQPSLSATNSFTVVVREANTAPVLVVPGNQNVDELTMLVVTNTATDADLPANTLVFGLVSGPTGVSLNPTTGVLTWTPTEAQGPSTNTITVKVTDNGQPSLSATNSFTVVVREANTAPVLIVPGPQTLSELTTMVVATTATDYDQPPNGWRFALVSAPEGVSVDEVSGVLRWTPSEAQGPGVYEIQLKVTDDGVPPWSTTNGFQVTVQEVNVAPTVALTAPANEAVYAAPVTLELEATAEDPDGNLERVEFFEGDTLLGQATAAPYRWQWTEVGAGKHQIVAVATDSEHLSTRSAPIVFRVQPRFTSVSAVTGASVGLSWTPGAGLKLQRTTSLLRPAWEDLPLSAGQSNATLTVEGAGAFYRLMEID